MSKTMKPQTCAIGTDDAAGTAIDFVLTHPGMSDWLKRTVRDALAHDPVILLNDLEILTQVLRCHASAAIVERLAGDQEQG
jgi:hypothetical protein